MSSKPFMIPRAVHRETMESIAEMWNYDNQRAGVPERWAVVEEPGHEFPWTLTAVEVPFPCEDLRAS